MGDEIDDIETYPKASFTRLESFVSLEDLLLFRFGDTDAGIFYEKAVAKSDNSDSTAHFVVFDGVGEQIVDESSHLLAVSFEIAWGFGKLYADTFALGKGFEVFDPLSQ